MVTIGRGVVVVGGAVVLVVLGGRVNGFSGVGIS